MSGFLDFLSPLVTAATQQAGNYENAQAQGQSLKRDTIIQQMMLARQQKLDAIDAALNQAKMVEAYGRAHKAERDAGALRIGDPTYASAMGAVSGAQEQAAEPFKEQLAKFSGDIAGRNSANVANIEGRNALAVAGANNSASATRQGNQQTFEQGQQARSLAAQVGNKLTEQRQAQSVQLVPNLVSGLRDMFSGPIGLNLNPSPIPPGTGITPPVTPVLPTKGLFDDVPNSAPQPQ